MANLCAANAITARRGKSRHTGRMSRTPGGAGRVAVALLAAAALLAAPVAVRPALAGDDAGIAQARQHFQRGKQLFDAGDYRAAMAEFAAADRAAPSPMLEFNIALCHERLGERAEAVRRYRLYLDRVPNATNRASVEAKIRTLEAEIAAEARPEPGAGAVGPGPVAPGPTPEQPPAGPAPEPPAADAGAAAEPTGDEELDRVAAIDIGRVRAERQGAVGAPAAGAPPAQPHGAGAGAPPAEPTPRASKPLYKQWWFWVVAGVGALIIIDIATSDSTESDARGLMLPEQRDLGAQPGGAVLLRF